jgi:GTP-binding protein EngB required for normal cell division
MNIMMLGHSNVGKTTYMGTMYGALQNGSEYNGFTVVAEHESVHEQLLYMSHSIRAGRYPGPSDQRSVYDFTLYFKSEPVFPFRWVDYRGGALLERSTSIDKERLIDDLKEADGVLIFVDAQAAHERRRVTREIGHMTTLLKAALGEREFPMPITIVFTKSDLIPNGAEESVVDPVRNLVEIISGSEYLIGAAVMVACGRRCWNVEQPVLHCIRVGLRIIGQMASARVEQAERMIEHYKKQASTLFGFLGDLFADDTNMDKARREAAAAQKVIHMVRPLIEPAEHLESHLESLIIF